MPGSEPRGAEPAMPPPGRATSVALIGYRGTGKTTVGRLLADRLGLDFADTDAEIERRLGRPIAEFWAEHGEPAFRDREEETLRDLTARPGLVLATGGGAILRPANREALRRFGPVVWLKADPHVLADRLRHDAGRRPALTSAGLLDEIAAVLAAREPLYRQIATLIVDTNGAPPRAIAARIARTLAEAAPS